MYIHSTDFSAQVWPFIIRWQARAMFVHVRIQIDRVVARKFHHIITEKLTVGKRIVIPCIAPAGKAQQIIFKESQHVCVFDLSKTQQEHMNHHLPFLAQIRRISVHTIHGKA
jgi:hypothetical protein